MVLPPKIDATTLARLDYKENAERLLSLVLDTNPLSIDEADLLQKALSVIRQDLHLRSTLGEHVDDGYS